MPAMNGAWRLLLAGLAAWTPGAAPAPADDPAPSPPLDANRIVLVRGTASTPNPAESRYAERVSSWVARWLAEAGIPTTTLTDEQVTTTALQPASVVLLCYNPVLPPGELAVLRAFLDRGGKLVVFFSSDRALAETMGFRLGPYKACPAYGQWSAMRFNADAPPHTPPRVRQDSRNIRPAYPASPSARTLAEWEDLGGRATGDPAWLRSDRGFWMTHVLLDDGDTSGKKALLLAILGQAAPAVWAATSRYCLSTVMDLQGMGDAEKIAAGIRERARKAGQWRAVEPLLDRAGKLVSQMRRADRKGRYADVVAANHALGRLLSDAYGLSQTPRPQEVRAVWDHTGLGLYPGDWDKTCQVLARSGFTDLIVNLLWGGMAHYDSQVLPPSETYREYGDQLLQASRAARRAGLRLHAWKVCWNLEGATPSFVERMKAQGRLQINADGATVNWLCPSHPANRQLEIDSLVEAVRLAPVAGVQLDYIRFPDSRTCFCGTCRREFERAAGGKLADWPAAVRQGPFAARYRQWRRDVVSDAVRQIAAATRAVRDDLRVSAAVYGKYPSCADSVGQDWVQWLAQGYLDFACPMNYTEDLGQFRAWVKDQTRHPVAAGRILPGIGVTARESRLSPVQTVDQMEAARQAGAPGFVLFGLNRVLEHEVLPMLHLSPAGSADR
jgi:uncharacterized lipoprotein YddW (UPF0748 family)